MKWRKKIYFFKCKNIQAKRKDGWVGYRCRFSHSGRWFWEQSVVLWAALGPDWIGSGKWVRGLTNGWDGWVRACRPYMIGYCISNILSVGFVWWRGVAGCSSMILVIMGFHEFLGGQRDSSPHFLLQIPWIFLKFIYFIVLMW
jgi:hypothetical protein